MIAISVTSTGHSRTRSSSCSASSRPFCEMCSAGVEVQVQRRPAVVVAQHRAVRGGQVAPALLGCERPAQVGLAQTVDEDREPAGRGAAGPRVVGQVRGQAPQAAVVQAHAHLRGECRLLLGDAVAGPATHRAEHEPAAWRIVGGRRTRVGERRGHVAERRRQVGDAELGRAVRDGRDAVVQQPHRSGAVPGDPLGRAEQPLCRRPVHILGEFGELVQRGARRASRCRASHPLAPGPPIVVRLPQMVHSRTPTWQERTRPGGATGSGVGTSGTARRGAAATRGRTRR